MCAYTSTMLAIVRFLALLLFTHVIAASGGDESVTFAWTFLDVRLEKPLSDHTATLLNGKIYLAGGCDSEKGNEFDENIGEFICTSISDSLYSFDRETAALEKLENLPRARYRHAAVGVNNKIWLLGGRNLLDNVTTQVDVGNKATWWQLMRPKKSSHVLFLCEGLRHYVE